MNINNLLYDCLVRIPNTQIVLRGSEFWLLDGIKYTHKLSNSWIGYMNVFGLIKKRSNGAVEFTDDAVSIAHTIKLESIKVESKKHKGYFFDAYISPEKWTL